jgi:hypothetical protein
MFVGALVLVAASVCFGQTETTARPAQDSGAKQNSEAVQNSTAEPLTVPSTPQIDFEARLQKMLQEGKLRPGDGIVFRDESHGYSFPSMILPSYCFTMRTYTFSRQADGSAPKLKGVSTCTRANNYQLREAKPDGKIYPPQ